LNINSVSKSNSNSIYSPSLSRQNGGRKKTKKERPKSHITVAPLQSRITGLSQVPNGPRIPIELSPLPAPVSLRSLNIVPLDNNSDTSNSRQSESSNLSGGLLVKKKRKTDDKISLDEQRPRKKVKRKRGSSAPSAEKIQEDHGVKDEWKRMSLLKRKKLSGPDKEKYRKVRRRVANRKYEQRRRDGIRTPRCRGVASTPARQPSYAPKNEKSFDGTVGIRKKRVKAPRRTTKAKPYTNIERERKKESTVPRDKEDFGTYKARVLESVRKGRQQKSGTSYQKKVRLKHGRKRTSITWTGRVDSSGKTSGKGYAIFDNGREWVGLLKANKYPHGDGMMRESNGTVRPRRIRLRTGKKRKRETSLNNKQELMQPPKKKRKRDETKKPAFQAQLLPHLPQPSQPSFIQYRLVPTQIEPAPRPNDFLHEQHASLFDWKKDEEFTVGERIFRVRKNHSKDKPFIFGDIIEILQGG